jgi:hypothetical protein
MTHRTVTVRFAEGDAAGVTAVVRIRRDEKLCAEITLTASRSVASFDYELDPLADNSYSYAVEYAWGYAREASRQGKSDADELIIPFPGSIGTASFPFASR